jgi:hypothetical protein
MTARNECMLKVLEETRLNLLDNYAHPSNSKYVETTKNLILQVSNRECQVLGND